MKSVEFTLVSDTTYFQVEFREFVRYLIYSVKGFEAVQDCYNGMIVQSVAMNRDLQGYMFTYFFPEEEVPELTVPFMEPKEKKCLGTCLYYPNGEHRFAPWFVSEPLF